MQRYLKHILKNSWIKEIYFKNLKPNTYFLKYGKLKFSVINIISFGRVKKVSFTWKKGSNESNKVGLGPRVSLTLFSVKNKRKRRVMSMTITCPQCRFGITTFIFVYIIYNIKVGGLSTLHDSLPFIFLLFLKFASCFV